MKRRTLLLAVLTVVFAAALVAHPGSAAAIRGTLANGWQRHTTRAEFNADYAGDSGFVALAGGGGWISPDGKRWKPAPFPLSKYAVSQHITDLNLVRVGRGGAVKGATYSIKAEGPNGGYIAAGSYKAPGQTYDQTRAEVAICPDGCSWRTVSGGEGKIFTDACAGSFAHPFALSHELGYATKR